MSMKTEYLNYLVYGGDFDNLPKPTSVNGMLLYKLCQYGGASEASVKKALDELRVSHPEIFSGISEKDVKKVVDDYLSAGTALDQQIDTKVNELLTDVNEEITSLKGNVWNAVKDGRCDNKGIIDCSEIVQNAINNAKDCTVLYFPKGTYLFKKGITIEQKKGLSIVGDGVGYYGTLFFTTYPYAFMIIYGGKNIVIENLSIKGNNSEMSRAIYFYDNSENTMECRCTDSIVRNVGITRFNCGIELSCPSGYNLFENVSVSMIQGNNSNKGYGFSIGETYKNAGTTEGGDIIPPNYIYFTNCGVDGGGQEIEIIGINIATAIYVVIDKCDLCNIVNGDAVRIINNNAIIKTCSDIFVSNTSLYNNKNGVSIIAKSKGIDRVSINNCMIVTESKGTNCYALSVSKDDSVDKVKNISFVGNLIRDYSNKERKFFNDSAVDKNYYYKAGLYCDVSTLSEEETE